MIRALQQIPGNLSKESLDLVDPGGVGGREVHVEPGVLAQPGLDRRVFVGGVVVADDVHVQALGDGFVDLDQEFSELHRAVLAVDLGDHRPIGNVECGEQTRGAVADIVVTVPLEVFPASSATPVGTWPRPAPGSFHQHTARRPIPVDGDTTRRCRRSSR